MKKYFIRNTFLAALSFLCITSIAFAQVIQTNAKPNNSVDMQRLSRIDDLAAKFESIVYSSLQ